VQVANVQELRNLKEYSGTPHGMRFFCSVMVNCSPVLLAPYWRNFCADDDAKYLAGASQVDPGCQAGYFNAVLYVLVLSTLYAVTGHIEDLWDGEGYDDVWYGLLLPRLRLLTSRLSFTLDLQFNEATRTEVLHTVKRGRVVIEHDDALGKELSAFLQRDEGGRQFASTRNLGKRSKQVLSPRESVPVRIPTIVIG